jgi:flagellar basal-body rod protein FlgF
MSGSIYMATSGAEVQRLRLEILSNNLANINTTGFKEDRAIFRLPEQAGPSAAIGGDSPDGVSMLAPSVIPLTMQTDYEKGPLQHTGGPLDLAIDGDGFFSVQTDQGVRYTRNGAFSINTDGVLATADGDPVLGEGGEIAIDGSDVQFDASGNVMVDGSEIDKLRIVKISDLTALRKIGKTLFQLDENRGAEEPLDYGGVQQGFLEGSNVNAVKAMTELIEVQRGYESYQKMIQTMGDLASRVIAGVGTIE